MADEDDEAEGRDDAENEDRESKCDCVDREDGGPGGDVMGSECGVLLLSVTAAVETVVRTETGELCVVASDAVRPMLALVVVEKVGNILAIGVFGGSVLDSATPVTTNVLAVSVVVNEVLFAATCVMSAYKMFVERGYCTNVSPLPAQLMRG